MELGNTKTNRLNEQIYNIFMDICRGWHLICLLAVFLAVVTDIYFSLTYVPKYETAMTVVINGGPTQVMEAEESEEISEAIRYILGSNVFLDMVKKDLDVSSLHGYYSVENAGGMGAMKIKSHASSPEISYRMMNTMKERYQDVMGYVVGDTKLRVIDDIRVPVTPVNSVNHVKNLILFGAIGALIAMALLGVRSYMRDTLKTTADVKDKLQIRSLANVQSEWKYYFNGLRFKKKRGLLITQMTTSFTFVETFKRLASRVESICLEKGYKSIVVNSTWEDEGKTSIIANLAITLSQMGRKVLVIDTDFGKPALHKIMSTDLPEYGLEEVLKGQVGMDEAIYHHDLLDVDMVFIKRVISDSTKLLEEEALGRILDEYKEVYDYILLDTAPASYLGLSMVIASHADAVMLVARQNFTPTVFINRTIDAYLEQGTPILGCVLNRSMPRLLIRRMAFESKGGVKDGN